MRKAKVIKTSAPKPAQEVQVVAEPAAPEAVAVPSSVDVVAPDVVAAPAPVVVSDPVPTPSSAVVEPAKATKGKKPKLVRDSFTFPESDYVLISGLKLRALSQGAEFKKSEILRAGLIALQALPDADLLKVLGSLERIKMGRPSKK